MANETSNVVGYVLKGFPRLSETFITNEIYLLETMGAKRPGYPLGFQGSVANEVCARKVPALRLHIFSTYGSENKKIHSIVNNIEAEVTSLPEVVSAKSSKFVVWLWKNLPKYLKSHLRLLLLRPGAYARAWIEAVRLSFHCRSGLLPRPKKVIYKDFLRAGYVALKVLESGGIRHLHAHFCHGCTTVAMFASQLTGIPFSFTAHAKDVYRRKLNPGDLLQIKLRRAQFVVTCTDANRRYLQSICSNGAPIHTIYHGVNTALFAPSMRQPDGVPLILSVGTLVEKKGFPCLIEACAWLKRAGIRFRCRIVGEEGDQLEQVQRMIQQRRLDDTVSLQGAVTQEQLITIYRQATVFVLPCQVIGDGDRDGIPNVLVEAMAMGIPVVSTSISGIPELVEDGVNGLLVAERDSTALAKALQRLLEEPKLRRQLGAAARKTVCQTFDSHETTVALQKLLVGALQFKGVTV